MVFFRLIFPNGLSSEYSIVTIIRVRRTTKKGRWYLWQVFDRSGGSQVGLASFLYRHISFQYFEIIVFECDGMEIVLFSTPALFFRYKLWLMVAKSWWSFLSRAC